MTLINICGASFSGTTMLDMMLGNSDDAASCGEVGAWYRPKRHDRVEIQCPCGADPCPRWAPFAGVPEARFHREALERWGVRYLSDSTKNLAWISDNNRWAAATGLKVVNILIWKEPASHAYSHWKRGTSFQDARHRFVRYHARFLRLGLPFVSVNYDELVDRPAVLLPEICRMVGISQASGREEFWKRRHHNLFGNVGTAGQVGQAGGKIRSSRELPPAFLKALAAHEDRSGHDLRRFAIVAALKRFDVRKMDFGTFDRAAGRASRPVAYWYYEERIKRSFRTILGRLRPPRLAQV